VWGKEDFLRSTERVRNLQSMNHMNEQRRKEGEGRRADRALQGKGLRMDALNLTITKDSHPSNNLGTTQWDYFNREWTVIGE